MCRNAWLHWCDSEGRRGGLALMWRDHLELLLIKFSLSHIHTCVKNPEESQWFFTSIYGHLEKEERIDS